MGANIKVAPNTGLIYARPRAPISDSSNGSKGTNAPLPRRPTTMLVSTNRRHQPPWSPDRGCTPRHDLQNQGSSTTKSHRKSQSIDSSARS
jgi:hypothetical protein